MNIVFEYVNISASDRLEELVRKKLTKLSEKYPFIVRADVFFKKENSSDNRGRICEIRLSVPGPRIFAASNEKSFEKAISETIRDIKDQLERRKGKMDSRRRNL